MQSGSPVSTKKFREISVSLSTDTIKDVLEFVSVVEDYRLAQLEIRKGPQFIVDPPSAVEFLNTDGAAVSCRAYGHPLPEITWMTEDNNVIRTIPDIREVYMNGTVVFLPFSSEMYRQDVHANVYRCTASNIYGRIVSSAVAVRAAMRQSYTGQVYDKYVIKGNTAVLQCRIPSYVSDDVIVTSWLTEDDEKIDLNSSYDLNSRYSAFEDGYFHIRDVQTSDDGLKFWCQMKHLLSGDVLTSSSSGTLHVKEPRGSMPPQVLHSKQEVRIQAGQNGQIPCVAEGYPPPNISWFLIDSRSDRYLIKPSKRFLLRIGSLVILEATRDDSGLYECYISNSVGNRRTTTKLVVSARLAATIIPKQQVVDIGQSATLNCSVTGFPVENVEWRKNGYPLERNGMTSAHLLNINSMSRNDGGMYQCFVANDVNSVQATSQVLLGGKLIFK
ncbi:Down syndrome cell adhesion molecule-like protein Dscam2 [Nymphon striatum]|nr:Down syndrome cell adhesion molecule-like protein Dscam2 [Nymphon striatum]